MEMGTHDYGDAANVGRPRTPEDDAAMRGEVPEGWVRLPEGGILPAKLAERVIGWGDDRDPKGPLRVARVRREMAQAVTEYHVAKGRLEARTAAGFGDLIAETMNVLSRAEGMAVAWQAYSDATGGPA